MIEHLRETEEILKGVKTTVNTYLYFAYGSNMNHCQMKKRCPESSFISKGKLEGYEFVYDGFSVKWKGAVANIIKKEGSVEGGIFKITESDRDLLDCYEGFPRSYQRSELPVKDAGGNICKAYVYMRYSEKRGTPSYPYRKTVIQGARDCGLSECYIKGFLEGESGDAGKG